MIQAQFRWRGSRIVAFSVTGHALTAPYGQDLLCAAVSALVQGTLLGLRKVVRQSAAGSLDSGRVRWRELGKRQRGSQVLLATLREALIDLSRDAPQALVSQDKREDELDDSATVRA